MRVAVFTTRSAIICAVMWIVMCAIGCTTERWGGQIGIDVADAESNLRLKTECVVGYCYEELMYFGYPDGSIRTMGREDAHLWRAIPPFEISIPSRSSVLVYGGDCAAWRQHRLVATRGYVTSHTSNLGPKPFLSGEPNATVKLTALADIAVWDHVAFFAEWKDLLESNSSVVPRPEKTFLYELILDQQEAWERRWGNREDREKVYREWMTRMNESSRGLTPEEWMVVHDTHVGPSMEKEVAEARMLVSELRGRIEHSARAAAR